MAIVKMKRLRAIMPSYIEKKVIKDLTRLGCVEIETPAYANLNEEESKLVKPASVTLDAARSRTVMVTGLDALNRYAPEKKSFLTPRRQVTEKALFDEETIRKANEVSEQISGIVKQFNETKTLIGRISAQKETLQPWRALDIPFEFAGGKYFSVIIGACPSEVDVKGLASAIDEQEIVAAVEEINADKEQKYILLVSHVDATEEALAVLKAAGFSQTVLKDLTGTAAENLVKFDNELNAAEQHLSELKEKIASLAQYREIIEQTSDALAIESLRETAMSSMLHTEKTIYFEGWVPEETEKFVIGVLEENGCAYEFCEMAEDEEPPVAIKNSKFVQPFGAITELYGLPKYSSLIDTNTPLAFSFILFFGIMLSDVGCGLVLSIMTFLILKKKKPDGGFKNFVTVMFYGGISAMIWGVLFGSWFGNAPTAIAAIFGKEFAMKPLWFDPLVKPMFMLVFTCGIGVVHIFIGMGLSAWRSIKQGNWKDAIFDTGFWYMIIIGAIGLATGLKIFMYIALLGALGVLLTAGRSKKNIFSRIVSGLGALYGSTSYLSDILSYGRLMALGMCTGVIASVMNLMGNLTGKTGVVAAIIFFIVFIIGQTFNLAISLLGAFIHSLRLEFVEYFGKFYESGGRKFKPLYNQTTYTQFIKEEN
ncbi:MAG: V-type ATP synthase subunit I [Eubacteriaceae bacterium]